MKDISKSSKTAQLNIGNLLTELRKGNIIGMDAADSAEIEQIMQKSKELYVKQHHKRAITYIEKRGRWKTRIGNPRKDIERTSRDALIDLLYKYYNDLEGESADLSTAFEWYIERKSLRGRLQSTLDRNRAVFLKYTPATLLKGPAADLNVDEIRDALNKKLDEMAECLKRKPKLPEFRCYLQILSGIYDLLLEKKIILFNPIVSIKAEDFCTRTDSSKKQADEKTFSPEQIKVLLKEAKAYRPNPRAFAVCASANSGLRAGELPCLKWSDIKDGYVHIYLQQRLLTNGNTRIGFETVDCTKNEKGVSRGGRRIPITEDMQILLDDIKKHQSSIGLQTDWVFCDDDGSPITKTSYELFLRRRCKKLVERKLISYAN